MVRCFRTLMLSCCAVALAGCALVEPAPDGAAGRSADGIAYRRAGSGTPTVVFESGLGDGMKPWGRVYDALAKDTAVFAYDRPGYGGTQATARARDGATIVEDLRRTLRDAGLPPPYLLVGHSIGGTWMELFARTHREEVVGLVLVDSRHAAFTARCLAADASMCEPPRALVALMPGASSEEYAAAATTFAQVQAAPALRPIPLAVLTGTRKLAEGPTFNRVWLETQRDLAAASPRSKHTVLSTSHYVHRDQPQAVIDAVREVLVQARTDAAR